MSFNGGERLDLTRDSRASEDTFENLLMATDGDIVVNRNVLRKMTHQGTLFYFLSLILTKV